MRRRRGVAALVAAGLAGIALIAAGCTAGRPAGSARAPAAAGGQGAALNTSQVYPLGQRAVPGPVAGDLLDGARLDLASARGRVVVLNFWASWCAPCRLESAELAATYLATKDLGVDFVGVDIRDTHDAASAFTADFHIPYPSLYDPPGRIALAFREVNPSVIPTTVVVDRSGAVAAVFRKAVTRTELEPVVRAVAAENS